MKRNLVKRVAAAVALAGIAAAMTACGSNNNNNGLNGPFGNSALSGQGQIALSPVIQFQGTAMMDPNGGILASRQTGALYMQSVGGTAAPNGPLQPCSLAGYNYAGRCGSDANMGISLTSGGGYGYGYGGNGQVQISGILQFNQVAWAYLQAALGVYNGYGAGYYGYTGNTGSGYFYGNNGQYPFPSYTGGYNSYGGAITSISITGTGSGLGMGVTTPAGGAQTGGAPLALYNGYVYLGMSNGQQIVVPF